MSMEIDAKEADLMAEALPSDAELDYAVGALAEELMAPPGSSLGGE